MNMMSALASAFTILFLCWSSCSLRAQMIRVSKDAELTERKEMVVIEFRDSRCTGLCFFRFVVVFCRRSRSVCPVFRIHSHCRMGHWKWESVEDKREANRWLMSHCLRHWAVDWRGIY